jgi:hypothetical protein
MKLVKLISAGFFLLLFIACKKSSTDTSSNDDAETTSRFTKCDCNNAKEYIKASFDGVDICFDVKNAGFSDNFDNRYYFDFSIGQDQLNMIRSTKTGGGQLQIYWGQTNIWNRPLPYVVPRTDLIQCEFVQFQLYDLKTNPPFEYYGSSGSKMEGIPIRYTGEMTFAITEIKNDTLIGTFSGKTYPTTATKVNVENGEFRVRIYRSI